MNGRLVRKTLSFSKQLAMLCAACVWEDVVYNLTRPVKTLRLEALPHTDHRWLQRSPAMAAGITDHLWSIREVPHDCFCTCQLCLGRLPKIEVKRNKIRTFAHAFTPPLNPLPIAWRGDFKMRFSPPLQVLERGPGDEVSESPEDNQLHLLESIRQRLRLHPCPDHSREQLRKFPIPAMMGIRHEDRRRIGNNLRKGA